MPVFYSCRDGSEIGHRPVAARISNPIIRAAIVLLLHAVMLDHDVIDVAIADDRLMASLDPEIPLEY